MIYLLTAIGLTPGRTSTVHIYIQTVHRTTTQKTIHITTQKYVEHKKQYIEQHKKYIEEQKTVHRTQKTIRRTKKKYIEQYKNNT
jgi:hypothetical protein